MRTRCAIVPLFPSFSVLLGPFFFNLSLSLLLREEMALVETELGEAERQQMADILGGAV